MKQIFSFLVWMTLFSVSQAQQLDSAIVNTDSLNLLTDTLVTVALADTAINTEPEKKQFRFENKLLNSGGTPVAMVNQVKNRPDNDPLFYLLAGLLLLLASLRYFSSRYFSNLFRVFANTSLKQSQLTDQLLQEKLVSMFYNLFFAMVSGVYIYVTLHYYKWIGPENRWNIVSIAILTVMAIYIIKYVTLKFTGWITGYKEATSSYIFIVFLFNKILGIVLVPLIILIIYANPKVSDAVVTGSFIIIALLLILRFFRSFSLLQHELKISRFHFLLYLAAVEILPLLLIYKVLMFFLNKNL